MDFNGQFDLNATYLATPRLTILLDTSTAYLSQPDQTIVGGSDQQNGDYVFSTTTVSAAYRLNGIAHLRRELQFFNDLLHAKRHQ